MFKNKKVLITGGTGTLGQELASQLLQFGCKEIRIFSRNEVAQVEMKRRFPDLRYIIGDIRDNHAVRDACKGVDIVFHLAALKHVPLCENQPLEAVKTNILGTQNIIKHCKGRLVYMSTDKADAPASVYGMTKAVAEKIALNAGGICIRSGNIWGSSGSVVPLFISQIKLRNEITLTDKNMTRFFIRVNALALFILKTCEAGIAGVFYPSDMRSFMMGDVAKVLIDVYGNKDTVIKEIGLRPGEKMHEVIAGSMSSDKCISDEKYIRDFCL